jgi:predicted MFS family arabinose efflux permease
MYFGFAIGAALGSVVITLVGVAWIGAAGACALIAAMVVSRFAWSRQLAAP